MKHYINLLIFERRGIKSMNIEKWCQNYLQRLPLDLLSSKYLIKGNFKIYKKTLQLRIKRIGDLVLSFKSKSQNLSKGSYINKLL